MDILPYTEDHKQFREKVRLFMAQEIKPNVDTWEENRTMPRKFWYRLGDEGCLCTTVPKEYGGAGRDFLYDVIVAEELVRTNHSGGGPCLHNNIVVPYITTFGSDEQKKKYLPKCVSGEIVTAIAMTEPDAGSDLAAITSTAVESDDEVVINGTKIFISCAMSCDLVIVAARDPEIKNPYKALSLYFVEDGTPGFKKGTHYDKMGMHSQDTGELIFSDCRIPVKNRLGKKGDGFNMLMQKLQQERLGMGIMGLAAAEYILERVLEYYKNSSTSKYPIPQSQVNQFAIVEMATELKIARTFLDKVILEFMNGKNVIIESSMVKYKNTELVRYVADRCLDLCGEFGSLEACSIARDWRDWRVMSIFGGTNEIMRQIISKFMGL
jgi:acyl-CoA dehydrogenase